MSIYTEYTNKTTKTYQLLSLVSSNKTELFEGDVDYLDFIESIAAQHSSLGANEDVKPVMYCLKADSVTIVVCSNKVNAKSYLKQLVSRYKKWRSEPEASVKPLKEDDLMEVSARVHTSADDWLDYEFSSVRAYLYDDCPSWLYTQPLSNLRGPATQYLSYLQSSVDA
jgi:hypothetical protein